MYKVYFILNRINGKAYCGVTQQAIRARLRSHRSEAKSGRTKSPLHRSLRKHGEAAFDILTIWAGASREDAFQQEMNVIAGMDLMNPAKGYNLSIGGESGSHGRKKGFHQTEETKQKLRLANLGNQYCVGRKLPYRARPEVSERMKGNNYASNMSQENREKLRERNRNRSKE